MRMRKRHQFSISAHLADWLILRPDTKIRKSISSGQQICIKEMCTSELWELVKIGREATISVRGAYVLVQRGIRAAESSPLY